MSSPNVTSEMAYFLQDNMVEFLKGATEEELTEFVDTLLPHISPVGVNRIYPVVSESFPTPSHAIYQAYARRDSMPETPVDEDSDEVRLNMRRGNPEREGTD